MGALSIRNVTKRYGATEVLRGIDIEAQDGEFLILVGPSGCGKSTLLNMIAGLDSISSGEIAIGGRVVNNLSPKDRDIAMVFQSYALYPTMSVRENIAFGLKIRKLPQAEIDAEVARVARLLQIEHLLQRKPGQLSGGQQQRVAMGRALARRPKIYLFDEPLSNLDAKLREQMRAEIRRIQQTLGITSVYVTHDQAEAMALSDRIVVMHQGKVVQVGTAYDVYRHPVNAFVADFIGAPAMNFLAFEGALAKGEETIQIGPARLGVPQLREDVSARPLLAGVRPEHVRFSDESALRAEVLGTEYLGTRTVVTLATAQGATVRAKVDAATPARRGDHVGRRRLRVPLSVWPVRRRRRHRHHRSHRLRLELERRQAGWRPRRLRWKGGPSYTRPHPGGSPCAALELSHSLPA